MGMLFSSNVFASAFTPADNAIIAPSNSNIVAQLSVAEINELVINSQYAGQTERLQGVLKTHLATLRVRCTKPARATNTKL